MNKFKRIVMLPLDARPCNLQYPKKLSFNDEIKLIMPNEEILGNKKTPANLEKIDEFLLKECEGADFLIVSVDMLVYGGLLFSRLHNMSLEQAEERLNILTKIKKVNPRLKIFAFSLIMRCPSYSSSEEEPDYYECCGEYIHSLGALIHKYKLNLITKEEFNIKESELKKKIRESDLLDYLSRRDFNVKINIKAVEELNKTIDFLVIPQDDSAEFGFTAMNQETVRAKISELGVWQRALMYPGADEVGLTLLSRAINEIKAYCPKVFVRYAAASGGQVIPLYEDRPLSETLKYQIISAGGEVAYNEDSADLIFAVSCPGGKMAEASEQGKALREYNVFRNLTEFVFKIKKDIERGKTVSVCDNAYANGADLELLKMLERERLLPRLGGYAAWNTSSNTAGTALFQGIMFIYFKKTKEHLNFLAERVVEDAGYCSVVRPLVSKGYIIENNLNYFLADGKNGGAARKVKEELIKFISTLGDFGKNIILKSVSLPWNRMFEVQVEAEFLRGNEHE